MILFLLAYLGGVLTILSPCILPVLPFVFAGAGRPFLRNGLPMLAGMALTFAAVATLAAVGGGWAVEVNRYGRIAAIVLLAGVRPHSAFPGAVRQADKTGCRFGKPAFAGRRPGWQIERCWPRSCLASRRAFSGRLAPGRS